MKKEGSITILIVILIILTLFIFINKDNMTGDVVSNSNEIASNSDYILKEVAVLQAYPWYMDSKDNIVYVGTYGGSDNYYFYSQNPFTNWQSKLITSTGEESLRVYNLNNRLYITGEDGFVSVDLKYCTNLKDKYVLGAEYFDGKYLVSIGENEKDKSAKTTIYNCPCADGVTCTKWKTLSGIRAFDMKEYQGYLYVIGTKDYRSGKGKVIKIDKTGNSIDMGFGYGEGVMAEKFKGKIYFGFSDYSDKKSAKIYSYNGSNIYNELSVPGMRHFGDFKEFDDKLFATFANDPGGAEIWYKEDQVWKKFASLPSNKYGGGIRALINPTGMMATAEDRLFFSFNTPDSVRRPPGYILELSKKVKDSNCNFLNKYKGTNNTLGLYNLTTNITDKQILCYERFFYECATDGFYKRSQIAINASNNQTIGDWTCDLNTNRWINKLEVNQQIIINQSNQSNQNTANQSQITNNSRESINYNANTIDSDSDSIINDLDVCPNTIRGLEVNARGCPIPIMNKYSRSLEKIRYTSLTSVRNFSLENDRGKILFKERVPLVNGGNSLDIDSHVNIEENKIEINSSAIPELNKSAYLSFYTSMTNPIVLKDGKQCKECKIIENNEGVIIVEVPHFTTYELVDNSTSGSTETANESINFPDQNSSNDQLEYSSDQNQTLENNSDLLIDDTFPSNQDNEETNIKKDKSNLLITLIIIAVLIIIGIIIYFIYKTKRPNEASSEQGKSQQLSRVQR